MLGLCVYPSLCKMGMQMDSCNCIMLEQDTLDAQLLWFLLYPWWSTPLENAILPYLDLSVVCAQSYDYVHFLKAAYIKSQLATAIECTTVKKTWGGARRIIFSSLHWLALYAAKGAICSNVTPSPLSQCLRKVGKLKGLGNKHTATFIF